MVERRRRRRGEGGEGNIEAKGDGRTDIVLSDSGVESLPAEQLACLIPHISTLRLQGEERN
jgi:hypothetical protein